jgi:hypothetical protein
VTISGRPGQLATGGPKISAASLERDPEKWIPVFRKIARQTKKLDLDPIPKNWIMV